MQDLDFMFMRYLDGECSAAEAQAIERMLQDRPEVRVRFEAEQGLHQELSTALNSSFTNSAESQIQAIVAMLPATTPVPHHHIRTSILGFWLLCSGMIFTTAWNQFNNSSESITTLLFMTCGLVFTAALAWCLARPRRRPSVMGAFDPRIDVSQWQQHGLRISAVFLVAVGAWIWS